MTAFLKLASLGICLALVGQPLCAQADEDHADRQTNAESDSKEDADDKKDSDDKKEKEDEPKKSVTEHKVTIDGTEIAYTATAGEMLLRNDQGDTTARVFYTAYNKDGVEHLSTRPVSFCFNGGPGSSAVWLHLGMLGPRRVKLPDDAKSARPPHHVVDNPHSLLDVTDLVFIDPVSTGYSRPEKDTDKKEFHGYEEDLRSIGQFIHNYVSEYGRWASPKFLIGESYGGLRAAGLSGTLQQRYNMNLNGIVLVSAVVDFQTLLFRPENSLSYALFVPSYTATAWYHDALPPDLQQLPLRKVVHRAERFVKKRYLPALMKGDKLPPKKRTAIAKQLARLTGLSQEFVEQSNLRVPMWRFGKELLRDRGKTVGRFDSRYLGIDLDDAGEYASYDPSGAAVFGPFTSAMNDYLFRELDFKSDRVYEILTNKVRPWSYDGFENRYVNASETLRKAMTTNPFLKVFAACGYYDLATPQYAMLYTRDHLGLVSELQENFSVGFYEGGHMMYIREMSLEKLRADLLKFYDDALGHDPASNEGS